MVREGADVSIFTYSRMRYVVMQAVAELEKLGYNPEVGSWLNGSDGFLKHQKTLADTLPPTPTAPNRSLILSL